MNTRYLLRILFLSLYPLHQSAMADSLEDWKKACDLSVPTDDVTQRLLAATAMIVPANYLTENLDGTFSLEPATALSNECPTSIFYGDLQLPSGRTGVLVGRKTLLTAAHDFGSDMSSFRVVFRSSESEACINSQLSNISGEDIYQIESNAGPFTSLYGQNYDLKVVTLERDVQNHRPVKIRRSGEPLAGQKILVAGYPLMAGLKIDVNGHFNGFKEKLAAPPSLGKSQTQLKLSNIHTLGGSSGSPIFNFDDEAVEIVNIGFANANYGVFAPETCARPVHVEGIYAVAGAIVDIESLVPRGELAVTPLHQVVHVASVGGALSAPITTYTIHGYPFRVPMWTIPPSVPKNRVIVSAPTVGTPIGASPTLTSSLVGDVNIRAPSGFTSVTLSADIGAVTACGTWDLKANINDYANEYNYPLRHRFEIGLKEASISPSDRWSVSTLAKPYGAIRNYTVTNPRPDPVTINLHTTANWLLVNGLRSETLSLSPAGSPGDQATLVLSLSPSGLDRLSIRHEHLAELLVDYGSSMCIAGPETQTREVSVQFGVTELTYPTPADPVPGVATWGAETVIALPLSEPSLCIDSLQLAYSFANAEVGGGTVANVRAQFGKNVDRRLIWQGGSVPSSPQLKRNTLYFDPTTPPTAGTALSYFNSMRLDGTWSVAYQSNPGYVSGFWMPDAVKLKIEASECP